MSEARVKFDFELSRKASGEDPNIVLFSVIIYQVLKSVFVEKKK